MKKRSEIDPGDQWNVEKLYPSLNQWWDDLTFWARKDCIPHWPEIATYKGRLKEGPEVLKNLLDHFFKIDEKIQKIVTYSYLRYDEDLGDDLHKKAKLEADALFFAFKEETAWIDPEILETLQPSDLEHSSLTLYKTYLQKMLILKKHTLDFQGETLLALAAKPLESLGRTFSSLNNVDFKFMPVADSQGKEWELSHGSYALHLRSKDRTLRRNAFFAMHRTFSDFENSLTELLQGHVHSHFFEAKARRYQSCLEAALAPHQIDLSVYHSAIECVRNQIQPLHRYMALRKQILGYETLHVYDLYVPLVSQKEDAFCFSYSEAKEIVVESVAPLGKEYQAILRKGLNEDRWVDRYENQNKRSGAYSGGCYTSLPYILMNYHNSFRDLLTLAHEAGHSMHSYFSNRSQPYIYANYPIFLAEIASTFHEELLFRYLLKNHSDPSHHLFLFNEMIDGIRTTFFRQLLFAEFELRLHERIEKNEPLTPGSIKELYRQLHCFYYGPSLTLDSEGEIEWARIPHFYSNFYVYQYATGLSVAKMLCERVEKGGAHERESYLQFLSSGNSSFPLETLSKVGIDMRSGEPINELMRQFSVLIDRFTFAFEKKKEKN
jgi:oligoendopeptidase F